MLTFRRSDCLELIGYSNSDYGGCPDDLISTSGCIFMLAEGVVSWKSVKQILTATSTMEAEYVACYEATRQAIWLKNFISELGVVESISRPLTIYCDNSVVVCFSCNNNTTKRSKHFDTKSCLLEKRSRNFKHELSIFPQS